MYIKYPDINPLPCVKQRASWKLRNITGAKLGAQWWPGGVGWGGERQAREGGDICIFTADWLCCTAESNITLWSNYTIIVK